MGYNRWHMNYGVWLILITVLPLRSYAGWSTQEEAVSVTWGSGSEQIGLVRGDTVAYDLFPTSFGVTSDGKVVIGDLINERIMVFNEEGTFLRSITNPTNRKLWPYEITVGASGCVAVGYVEFTHTFDIRNGALIGVALNMGGVDFVNSDCSKIYVERENWHIYSPTGQLLSTSPTRPLELGRWSWRCLEGVKTEEKCFKHHIEIEYPDAVFVYEVTKPLFKSNLKDQVRINNNLIMDNKGEHVYAYSVTGTYMPEGSTRPIKWLGFKAEWVKPKDSMIFHPDPEDTVAGGDYEIIAQYGTAVLGPDGSIYTWCRSETHYKILRWRWVP